MFLEKSSVFKQFSHRKIPVRQAGRDQPDIYFGKVEFTLAFDLFLIFSIVKVNSGRSILKTEATSSIAKVNSGRSITKAEVISVNSSCYSLIFSNT